MPRSSSSSSSASDSKRPHVVKESVCTSSRRSQSVEGRDVRQGDGVAAKQDAIVEEDKAQRGEPPVVAMKREEPVFVAPRGRGRPRKVRPILVEVPIMEVQVPDVEALVVTVRSQGDEGAEAASTREVIKKQTEVVHVDADVVESSEVQEDERNADIGNDAAGERNDGDVGSELLGNGGDAGDVVQAADGENNNDGEPRQESRHAEAIQAHSSNDTAGAFAHDEEAQETIDDKPSAPMETARKASRVSSNTSDNGSTVSTQAESEEPGSSNKRSLEDQRDFKAHVPHDPAKKQKTTAKISPTSSQNLFQFTCRLLEAQKLEYEVRAREFEEKTALLAVKRARYEKKIRRVKRQLRAYGHPVDVVYDDETSIRSANGSDVNGPSAPDSRYRADPDWEMAGASTALMTPSGAFSAANVSSASSSSLITMHDAFSSRTSFPAGVNGPGTLDSLLSGNVQNLEAQIRETLGARAQLVQGMMKDLQDMRGLNDKITCLR